LTFGHLQPRVEFLLFGYVHHRIPLKKKNINRTMTPTAAAANGSSGVASTLIP